LAKRLNAFNLRLPESKLMNQRPTSRFQKKPRSRYGFLGFCFVSLLAAFTVLRLVLLLQFGPPSTAPWNVLLAFAAGFYRDVIAALWFMLPPLFWCFVAGNPALAVIGLITALNLTQCLRDARRFRAEIEFHGHHHRLGDLQGGQRFYRVRRRRFWGRSLLAAS
jgi:hypothetical protein